MTEEEIIKGCLEGNSVAQRRLYDTFATKMMGVCLRYGNNHDEAQDILQDGFVKIFEKLGTFKGNGSLEGWMRRIFVNTALDSIRKNKAMKNSVEVDTVEYLLPAKDYILEEIAAKELLKILQMIPVGYKTVFNLYAIEGYSHKEIAEMLNISVNTSKSQYSRAKSYLRSIIESEQVA